MKNKLDFIYVGPQRTASSWLREVLVQHPEIHLPKEVKETYTFSSRKGVQNRTAKHVFKTDERVRGEFCTMYFMDQIAMRKIQSHNPECKIIIGVREPVEKAWSLFQHHYALGEVSKDFFEACYAKPGIIFSGHYKFWIPLWEDIFGEENIFLFDYHHLKQSPDDIMQDLASFLHISYKHLNFDIEQRVGEAVIPTNPWVSGAISNIAQLLRNRDWHWMANAGKRLGFKKLIGQREKINQNENVNALLREIYKKDIHFLQSKGMRIEL